MLSGDLESNFDIWLLLVGYGTETKVVELTKRDKREDLMTNWRDIRFWKVSDFKGQYYQHFHNLLSELVGNNKHVILRNIIFSFVRTHLYRFISFRLV